MTGRGADTVTSTTRTPLEVVRAAADTSSANDELRDEVMRAEVRAMPSPGDASARAP